MHAAPLSISNRPNRPAPSLCWFGLGTVPQAPTGAPTANMPLPAQLVVPVLPLALMLPPVLYQLSRSPRSSSPPSGAPTPCGPSGPPRTSTRLWPTMLPSWLARGTPRPLCTHLGNTPSHGPSTVRPGGTHATSRARHATVTNALPLLPIALVPSQALLPSWPSRPRWLHPQSCLVFRCPLACGGTYSGLGLP